MSYETTHASEYEINVYLVNSFTRDNTGGNPAGVIFNPPELSDTQKIEIARQVGFSETAFVYTGESAGEETDYKVDFFTPESEVDFCGHATLAVFFTLFSLNQLGAGTYSQKTKAGILNVTVSADGVIMEQALPITRQGPDVNAVATALGIPTETITKTGLPIEIISTGLPDILVPVQPSQLDNLKPDYDAIAQLSREFDSIGFHVFELSRELPFTAHCRNFAPLYGINEESATGSASGALGCYLVKHVFPTENHFLVELGRAMGCSSQIQGEISHQDQAISRVCVGGQAATIGIQTVHF